MERENTTDNIVATLSSGMLAVAITLALRADDEELDEMIKAARTILGKPQADRHPFQRGA